MTKRSRTPVVAMIVATAAVGCGSEVFLDANDTGVSFPDAAPNDSGPTDRGVAIDAGEDAGVDAGVATRSLTVLRVGCGAATATVTSDPAGLECGGLCSREFPEGSSVRLSASGAAGMPFTGWSGGCSGAGGCELNMSEDRRATARLSDLSWAREVGGELNQSYGHVRAIATSGETAYLGGYYGSANGTSFFDFGAPAGVGCDPTLDQLAYVVRVDSSSGRAAWRRCIGSDDAFAFNSIGGVVTVGVEADVLTTGHFDYQQDSVTDPAGTVNLGGGPIQCLREGDVPELHGRGLFLARYAHADGAHLWSRHYCIDVSEFQRLAVGAGEEVYSAFSYFGGRPISVGGSTIGGSLFGLGLGLAKYSAVDGSHLWSVAYGADTVDPYGNIFLGQIVSDGTSLYVTGIFQGTVDFVQGPVTMSSDAQDMFLAKYRGSDGALVWMRTSDIPRPDGMSYVAQPALSLSSAGEPIVGGQVFGTVDLGLGPVAYSTSGAAFLAKYSPVDGAPTWVVEVPCTETFHLPDLAVGADDQIYFGGALCDFGDGAAQGLSIARYSGAGAFRASRTVTSSASNLGVEALSLDAAGRVVFAGTMGGTANYCDENYYTAGFDGVVYGAFGAIGAGE